MNKSIEELIERVVDVDAFQVRELVENPAWKELIYTIQERISACDDILLTTGDRDEILRTQGDKIACLFFLQSMDALLDEVIKAQKEAQQDTKKE